MAWFELHQAMPAHIKTLRLARTLEVSRFEAVGIMCCLWAWALDVADYDGSMGDASAQDIADAIRYPGDAEKLIAAITSCGYLERDGERLVLHDWGDYGGRLAEQREIQRVQSRDRQQKRRERLRAIHDANKERDASETPSAVTRDTCVNNEVTPHYTTVPYILSDSDGEIREKSTEKEANAPMIDEIVKHLNKQTGASFRSTTAETRKLINGRISDGYKLEDFTRVIDDRCRRWRGTDQEQYLRPSTLFRLGNFESYFNAIPKQAEKEYFHSDIDVFGNDTYK